MCPKTYYVYAGFYFVSLINANFYFTNVLRLFSECKPETASFLYIIHIFYKYLHNYGSSYKKRRLKQWIQDHRISLKNCILVFIGFYNTQPLSKDFTCLNPPISRLLTGLSILLLRVLI